MCEIVSLLKKGIFAYAISHVSCGFFLFRKRTSKMRIFCAQAVRCVLLLLTLSHAIGHPLLEFSIRFPVHLGCIHIGGRLEVRIGEHRDHRQEDRLHGVHWQPALLWSLVAPSARMHSYLAYGFSTLRNLQIARREPTCHRQDRGEC